MAAWRARHGNGCDRGQSLVLWFDVWKHIILVKVDSFEFIETRFVARRSEHIMLSKVDSLLGCLSIDNSIESKLSFTDSNQKRFFLLVPCFHAQIGLSGQLRYSSKRWKRSVCIRTTSWFKCEFLAPCLPCPSEDLSRHPCWRGDGRLACITSPWMVWRALGKIVAIMVKVCFGHKWTCCDWQVLGDRCQ